MKKRELIDAVAHATGMKKTAVETVLETAFGHLAGSLCAGEESILWGIGKLKPAIRAARTGRNPATGEALELPAKTYAKFVAGKELDARLNP